MRSNERAGERMVDAKMERERDARVSRIVSSNGLAAAGEREEGR